MDKRKPNFLLLLVALGVVAVVIIALFVAYHVGAQQDAKSIVQKIVECQSAKVGSDLWLDCHKTGVI